MYTAKNLFIITFLFIISTYFYVFGQNKTLEILQNQYLYVLGLFVLIMVFFYFRNYIKKLHIDISNIPKVNLMPLNQSLGFFIFFCIIDYYYEDGFEGMISQWIIYWIFGLISIVLLNLINYYKIYKLIKAKQ